MLGRGLGEGVRKRLGTKIRERTREVTRERARGRTMGFPFGHELRQISRMDCLSSGQLIPISVWPGPVVFNSDTN